MIKNILIIFTGFILIFLVYGCGCPYSFTGASVPAHLKKLAIPIVEDRSGSGEPNLRENLTTLLTRKFVEDNNFTLTDRSKADAVLECSIISISDAPAVVSAGENVSARRITISVKVVYRDLVKRTIIFEKTFSNYGDYSPSGGSVQRNSGIQISLDKISEDILLDTVSGW